MGYRPQVRSPGSGRGHQKSIHGKAKAKSQRHPSGSKYLEEAPAATLEEVMEKTLSRLSKLGSQTFALSPFSQYFDDWLVNLRQVLSEFESSPATSVDEAFVKERSQILTDVERELAQKRLKEAALEESAKTLSENNHLLAQMDAEYAAKARELSAKRNAEMERLTRNAHDLEEELEHVQQAKTSFLNPFAKKAKAKKEAETTQKMDAAKKELESAIQNFAVEQEKLHDEYEKRKQVVIEEVRNLEKDIEHLETDSSLQDRQAACSALANAVNALLGRKAVSH